MTTEAEKAAYAAKHYPVRETDVESKACAYARARGCWVAKYKSSNNRGLPDRQFKHRDSREFYIEFKKPGKVARRQQELVIHDMRRHGFLVFVCDTFESAKAAIDAALAGEAA